MSQASESSGPGFRPEFPLREMLGFTMEPAVDGVAVATLEIDARHINPHGTVHGAVMFMLLDTAMGAATMSCVDEGYWCATLDIHIRYLAPCFGGRLVATARVRKAGRRIVQLDGEVSDGDGNEYVTATGAFSVIRQPS